MARDRGQIYEASDWYKEALQINQVGIVCSKIGKCISVYAMLEYAPVEHDSIVYQPSSYLNACSLTLIGQVFFWPM